MATRPGARLEAFLTKRAKLPRKNRSALERALGVSRQQLGAWFDGKGEMRMSALKQAADAVGVRRVDLIAVYDGVIAPEQEETPRPEWAEGFLTRKDAIAVIDAMAKAGATAPIARELADAAMTALGLPPPDEPVRGKRAKRPANQEQGPTRSESPAR